MVETSGIGIWVNGCSSAVGNRMNEVMKLLTVISTISPDFVAGIYGMNFNTSIALEYA